MFCESPIMLIRYTDTGEIALVRSVSEIVEDRPLVCIRKFDGRAGSILDLFA